MHDELNARIQAVIDGLREQREKARTNGLQDGLSARVRAAIDDHREREKALAFMEEVLVRTGDPWHLAISIKELVSQQTELWRRFFRDRYDFDVQRWLARDPTDLSSLPQARGRRKTDEVIERAWAYAFWEFLRILTQATEKVATKHGLDRDRAICGVFLCFLRRDTMLVDEGDQRYSGLPPVLSEELLIEDAGWLGSRINLSVNKRLYPALSGWGEDFLENLARELPGAIFAAFDEHDGDTQHRGSFVTRVARALENLGGESTSRPGKLTSFPSEITTNTSEDEGIAEFERKVMLDALEQAAGLSPRQAAVWQRTRQGMGTEKIAEELGISENSVSVHKHNAIEKLREARRATGL